jgi:hypothetical protein
MSLVHIEKTKKAFSSLAANIKICQRDEKALFKTFRGTTLFVKFLLTETKNSVSKTELNHFY